MLFFWWLIAVLLFTVLFLPFLPLKFILQLNRNRPDDYLKVVFRFYFFSYKKILPLKEYQSFLNQKIKRSETKLTAAEVGSLDDLWLFYQSLEELASLLSQKAELLKDTYWEKFEFNLSFGTGNPAYTGILNGLLWSLVSVMLSRLLPFLGSWGSNPQLILHPDFQKKTFSLKLDCIFYLPFGHLIDIVTSRLYLKLMNRAKNFLHRRG
ncbi:MAG: DUF2953 domain-containing protein [bacterium]